MSGSRNRFLFVRFLLALLLISFIAGQGYAWNPMVNVVQREVIHQPDETEGGAAEDDAAEGEEERESFDIANVTLERLFPEKSYFGPSASQTGFSPDGRYGAYLYRPYAERRHGNDLWLHDFESGTTKRITKVSVLRDFQQATRQVSEDRIKKAKKKGYGKKQKGDSKEVDEGESAASSADADDPVSGEWAGLMTGGEALGLPAGGVPFTLVIELGGKDSVSGTFIAMDFTVTVTNGRFDREQGTIELRLTDPESGLTADLNASIAEGTMDGEITLPGETDFDFPGGGAGAQSGQSGCGWRIYSG